MLFDATNRRTIGYIWTITRSPTTWKCKGDPRGIMSINWNNIQNNVTMWVTAGIGAISVAILVMGEAYDWPSVSANGALALLSLFYVALAMPFIARERVLLVGVLPGTVAVFATWLPVVFTEAEQPELFVLLPLPMVAAFLVLWTPVAWAMFRLTCHWRDKPVLGALAETLAMSFLVLPWLLAAVVLPSYLDQNNATVAAVVAIAIGLLWSKLLSDPFAKFVKAIAQEPQSEQEEDRSE